MSRSGGLPLGVEPNQVLRQDGGYGVWLGGAMWSAPQAELRQFLGQADLGAWRESSSGRGRGPPHRPD
jgi:hypothetical protein